MGAAGAGSAALMGISEGGPMSILFAATYPERTRALVLCGAEVKEETTDDWPGGEATREEFEQYIGLDNVVARWGTGLVADHIVPSRKGDQDLRRWFGRLQTQGASSPVSAAARSTPPATVSSRRSTVRLARSVAHARSSTPCARSTSRYGQVSIRARSS